MNRELLLKSLRLQAEYAEDLKNASRYSIEFRSWREKTREVLGWLYGPQSETIRSFNGIKYGRPSERGESTSHFQEAAREAYLKGLGQAVELLETSLKTINEEAVLNKVD